MNKTILNNFMSIEDENQYYGLIQKLNDNSNFKKYDKITINNSDTNKTIINCNDLKIKTFVNKEKFFINNFICRKIRNYSKYKGNSNKNDNNILPNKISPDNLKNLKNLNCENLDSPMFDKKIKNSFQFKNHKNKYIDKENDNLIKNIISNKIVNRYQRFSSNYKNSSFNGCGNIEKNNKSNISTHLQVINSFSDNFYPKKKSSGSKNSVCYWNSNKSQFLHSSYNDVNLNKSTLLNNGCKIPVMNKSKFNERYRDNSINYSNNFSEIKNEIIEEVYNHNKGDYIDNIVKFDQKRFIHDYFDKKKLDKSKINMINHNTMNSDIKDESKIDISKIKNLKIFKKIDEKINIQNYDCNKFPNSFFAETISICNNNSKSNDYI